jgi:hypothetical protein
MPNNACMSESTDADREEDGDSAETCMHQTYNYLHAAHNESRLLSGQTVETHVHIPLDRSAHVATGAGRRQGMQTHGFEPSQGPMSLSLLTSSLADRG